MGAPNAIVPELLTKENYGSWKIWMKSYLLGKELWDIVDGTQPKPDEATEAHRIWRKKNGKALHAIQVSCGPGPFFHISELDSAKFAWDRLVYMHQQPFSEKPTHAPDSSSTTSVQGQSSDDNTWRLLLYKAVVNGNWESTKSLLEFHPEASSTRLSMGETILHTAVMHKHVQLVEELVKLMPTKDMELSLPYRGGATALHLAALGGIVKIAEIMVEKNGNLLCLKDEAGYLPVTLASITGHKDMLRYLYSVTPHEELILGTSHNGATLFTTVIMAKDYEFALDIHRRCPQLTLARNVNGTTAFETLSVMPSAFPSGSHLRFWQRWIYNCINLQLTHDGYVESSEIKKDGPTEEWISHVRGPASNLRDLEDQINMIDDLNQSLYSGLGCLRGDDWDPTIIEPHFKDLHGIKQIYDMKLEHMQVLELLKSMSNQVSTLNTSQIEGSGVPGAVISASQFGIVEFVVEMVKSNPALLWVNTQSGGIFHVAVSQRQERIWNLIYGFGAQGGEFAIFVDMDLNTLLHLAGMLAPANRLSSISGAAMQMQRELQWFKEVEMIVPPLIKELMNKSGKTGRGLFTEQHKDLVKEGEKWMKDTATSCMVVATLIATVMFAAAFTVPGGNDDQTGIPMFLQRGSFMIFIISDAVSLFSSTTSVLMFLSILTSRYAEEDFLKSLPKRLIIGLATLLVSIAAMMVAFSATLVIVLGDRYKWTAIPVSLLASVPVTLFALLQFPLFVDMVSSTYGSGIFRKQTECLVKSIPSHSTSG